MISLIVAFDLNRLIGQDNSLPWHLPADLKHFKQLTLHKPIIMGRKTYESIGKALPERRNIIITHQKNYQAEACEIVHSLSEALAKTSDSPEIMIIGGAQIFAEGLALAETLYITEIQAIFTGETFFPEIDLTQWQEMAREKHFKDEKNAYDYDFCIFKRKEY